MIVYKTKDGSIMRVEQFKNLLTWYAVENVASKLLDEEENREVA